MHNNVFPKKCCCPPIVKTYGDAFTTLIDVNEQHAYSHLEIVMHIDDN